MQVRVLLFGPHAAAIGAPSVPITLDGDHTCKAALVQLERAHPRLAPLLTGARLAVNHAFAESGREIAPTDEVALIALVSGG